LSGLSVLPYFDYNLDYKRRIDKSFSSSLFRQICRKTRSRKGSFQFFLISTILILAHFLQNIPFSSSLFRRKQKVRKSIYLFSFSSSLFRPVSETNCTVVPTFSSSLFRHSKGLTILYDAKTFSSSLFRRSVSEDCRQDSYFQFFLIST